MPRQARNEVIGPNVVQVLHCVQRCVRRAFLCGDDPLTGKSFEHRREWIRLRMEFLASVFAIDCLTYTILHNHLHIVLRSRPDVLETWSDQEVARRALRLFPKRRNKDGSPKEPTQEELNSILNDAEKLTESRRRLSDVSWWMKCAAENIARRSNREDEVTGHFWEGRFKVQLLLDEASLLACAAYVDLNPIRAALAESPEASEFTGAKDRLDEAGRKGTGINSLPQVDACSLFGFAETILSHRLGPESDMPRQARNEVIDPDVVQVLHCVQRCVRRAFLCGDDPLTGKSFEHRREWIRLRMEFLASVFAIDCLTYTILHNHLHIVLRSRPDVLKTWSDEEMSMLRNYARCAPTASWGQSGDTVGNMNAICYQRCTRVSLS